MLKRSFFVVGLALLTMLLAIVAALISTFFLYAGWNWGFVPAVGVRTIDIAQAFWLSLGLSVIGSLLKGTSVSKSD